MRRAWIRLTAYLLLLILLTSAFGITGYAEQAARAAAEPLPELSAARAVYFYHLESGRCMGAKNENQRLPAGSTVKLLSGLIFCEEMAGGLQNTVEIRQEMLQGVTGHRYRMEAGELYTVEQLLYLSVCAGYNDAFFALAYLIGGGSAEAFAERMNQRAVELGATETEITEPTGITDSSFTTAADLFRIGMAATENTLYMRLSGAEHYDLYDVNMEKNVRVYNRSALISKSEDARYYNPLCSGLTAGYTNLGGWSLVTVSQKGNDRYLCVVLGAEEGAGENPEKHCYTVANRLIQWGYANYSYVEVLTPETVICSIPVRISDITESVEVRAAESLSFYLPDAAADGEGIRYSIRLIYDSLEAPVTVGTHVGYVAVIYGEELLGTVPIYTAGEAARSGFVSNLTRLRSLTEQRSVRAGLIFFALSLIAWILAEYLIKRARHRKWDRYFSEKIDTSETFLTKGKK